MSRDYVKSSTDITIQPARLSGSIAAIPSKSYAQRILIAAALASNPTNILMDMTSLSSDISVTIKALRNIGITSDVGDGHITVMPNTGSTQSKRICCGESAATARLLLPVLCALRKRGILMGEGSLLNRPFASLCKALEVGGMRFSSYQLPIKWRARNRSCLQPAHFQLPGDESSQYLSGLLFALPLLAGDSTIELTSPLQSAGYVDMTLDVLQQFGIAIEHPQAGNYRIPGNQQYVTPGTIAVEGDWSNAAFWLAAGVEVTELNLQSLQRDKLFVAVQNQAEIDVTDIPDLVPILAVWAALRKNQTYIHGIERLRLKESDRIASTLAMLQALGCTVQAIDDGLLVQGAGQIRGGIVDGANDHRIVMAAAVAASYAHEPVTIIGAAAVAKTYPHFFEDYRYLGGVIA
ncbi:MAG: 3-phosphoshikimate 1-carboxyvinyltransferase [Coriobacteriia bacterium]|nr:3-phosphoshikimate 1-carboxyvinyltransferase [Coriobacteriia bacterium]